MSDYIEVDWEVNYEAGECVIEKADLAGCKTRESIISRIRYLIHEDALQYIETTMLNTDEIDAFIDEVIAERESKSE